MTNQKGFTLIEMLIVLTIISTLLILLIPNLAEKNTQVQDNGCKALAQMTESQLQAYEIDTGKKAEDIQTLITSKYLKMDTCANGTQKVQLTENNTVEVVEVIK
ncbi:competence type IV pilus major pilin ComGC [Aquibacillus saliphilus]|uniref:competence type IV pilus major pilin ComGC n=1 Tax=Aquibacillus saliphilus TaxID=1909422 RepID=UPI001CF04E90|nr:competence type IV pilus major pilin ComGC [Aquibacillus saliphilus]